MKKNQGWGTDTDKTGQCRTGEEGPSPFKMCQVHTYIPDLRGGPTRRFKGCGRGKSPTAYLVKQFKDGLCARLKNFLRLRHFLKRHFMMKGVSEIKVVSGKHIRQCYHENRGKDRRKAGWCATCRPRAKPGEHGYCGEGSIDKEKEQMLNFTTNWGFCLGSKACTE